MKTLLTKVGWLAGFLYGLVAVAFVYSDAPISLQAFILIGVTAAGASAGYLIGFITSPDIPEEEC